MNAPSPYRLAIVDLDDTLLGHDKTVSAANLQALQRLRDAGLEVVVASGRHHDNIAQFEKSISVTGWVISSAGAMVRHAVTREILHEITVPVPLADEVLAFARQHGISAVGYHRTGIYFETDTEWMRLDEKRSGQPAKQGDLNELARDGLQKVMYAAAKPDIDRLYERMAEEYGSRLYVVHTENELMEFLSPEANKARGAETVMRKLGLSVGQIVAFGDGNNDVPVLSWAGMSVAMNHGRESARRAAKRVTPPGPMEEAFARGVDLVLGGARG